METWVYFWALYSIPLVHVCVLMLVPSCFDYTGLVIQFNIRYCDPSYFANLSQNCCRYSGWFMVPNIFLKCFYICEICPWYFNRYCIESINCFGYYGHFDDVNSSNPWTWNMFPFVCVLIFFFSVFYSFLSTGLLPHWWGLFLGILFFLLLIQMDFFSWFLFLIFHCWYTKMPLISEYWLCILLFCWIHLLDRIVFWWVI